MTYYSKLTFNEIKEIASFFSINAIVYCKIIKGGQINFNYLIKTPKEKYILTIFNLEKFEKVKKLVNLVKILEENAFPTTQLIKSKNHAYIGQYDNKYVIIKKYIEGKTYQDLDKPMLTQIGVYMAKLHEIPTPSVLSDNFMYGIGSFKSVTCSTPKSQYLGQNKDYIDWLLEKEIYLRKRISNELPKGLIHADIFWDNVLYDNRKLRAIIDFERACHYLKVFDIGMSFIGTCIKEERISMENARAIISGYQKIRILRKKEKEKLKDFTEYAAVATSFGRFKLKDAGIPKEKLRDYKEMMRIADYIHSHPSHKFIEKLF